MPGLAGCPKPVPRGEGCPKPLPCACPNPVLCPKPPEKAPLLGAAELMGACGCPNADADWLKPAKAFAVPPLEGCPKPPKRLGAGGVAGVPNEMPLLNGEPADALAGVD